MLEHLPSWLGERMGTFRAGSDKLLIAQRPLRLTDARLELTSSAFWDGGVLPVSCTADGDGVSLPLAWTDPPAGTAAFALIVEDPDAPSVDPFVHALIAGLPAGERQLAEGAMAPGAAPGDVGRNTYLQQGWLPPDPPTGHGPHSYVFQLFALAEAPQVGEKPGRSALADAIEGKVLAAGVLVGTYERPS